MIPVRTLALSALALAAITSTGCSGGRDLEYKQVETEELKRQNKELERLLAEANAKKATAAVQDATAAGASKTDATRKGVGAGVDVDERQREVVLTIENSILFKPGKAELSSQAKATLARVVATITAQYPDHWVRVEGHTDNEAIVRSKDQWKDNWDLAGGRAQAVLHYLVERGLPARDLGFAGYGEQRPVASNGTEAGQAKNRRVEIVVLPKIAGEVKTVADEAPAKHEKHEPAKKKVDTKGIK
jgi:chemotaxis protein MotB